MVLNSLSIMNYKNIAEATLDFSSKVNCLLGNNGMGKTNILDAIYYLSFCKNSTGRTDANTVRYGEEFMLLQGRYTRRGEEENVSCALQRQGITQSQRTHRTAAHRDGVAHVLEPDSRRK